MVEGSDITYGFTLHLRIRDHTTRFWCWDNFWTLSFRLAQLHGHGPETSLNYLMMVERYPNLKEEVGGSIPNCEISSLLDRKLARWSSASYALALACRPSGFFKKKNKKKQLHGHGSWLVCEVALIRYQKMDMYANLHTPHTCWCKAPVNDSYQHGTLLELV